MRRRWVELVAALLAAIWLGAIGVTLFYVARLASVIWLLGAIVALIGAFAACAALLLVTNTRRPAGIDPDAPGPDRRLDPFALPTSDLRIGVELPDGKPYGRRAHDDTAVVKRLIRQFEDEDAQRPAPAAVPDWARELQQEHADEQ